MEKPITIVLVEDEDLVRASVRQILEEHGFAVRGEAAGAAAGIETALRERPQLCLVDIELHDGDGIEVARRVHREMPETAVVIFSGSSRQEDLLDAIRAGAAGYLLKGMDPDRLAHALRGVVNGEAAIPRPLMAALVQELQTQGRRKTMIGLGTRVELTRREWEVLDLLCDRLATRQIAERLSVSPVTVRRHISEIVHKLGVDDRAQAVALVEGRL
ncbi:MAG TPA: response regulator transcription factor [Solirubrobacterales bacterium]|jgi:DNA-binding NarL/FixJ family response regulator|nr:response regulator transcription factor [Solirubrobacterales bacterium]